jgi:hypothetical protein
MLSVFHKGGRTGHLEPGSTNLETETTPKASRKVKFLLGRAKREPFLLHGIIRSIKVQHLSVMNWKYFIFPTASDAPIPAQFWR